MASPAVARRTGRSSGRTRRFPFRELVGAAGLPAAGEPAVLGLPAEDLALVEPGDHQHLGRGFRPAADSPRRTFPDRKNGPAPPLASGLPGRSAAGVFAGTCIRTSPAFQSKAPSRQLEAFGGEGVGDRPPQVDLERDAAFVAGLDHQVAGFLDERFLELGEQGGGPLRVARRAGRAARRDRPRGRRAPGGRAPSATPNAGRSASGGRRPAARCPGWPSWPHFRPRAGRGPGDPRAAAAAHWLRLPAAAARPGFRSRWRRGRSAAPGCRSAWPRPRPSGQAITSGTLRLLS